MLAKTGALHGKSSPTASSSSESVFSRSQHPAMTSQQHSFHPRPVEYQLHCFPLVHRPGHGSSHDLHNGGLFTFTEAKEAKFTLLTMVRILKF